MSYTDNHSDSIWRWMWIAFLLAHKFLKPPLFTTSRGWFWPWWYRNAYGEHGVYALVWLAKEHGYPWAQPFGEGEEGVRKYLGGRWLMKERKEQIIQLHLNKVKP